MIPMFKVAMSPDASKNVAKVLDSGYVGQGEIVEKFEAELRKRLASPYVLTVNSCTSGLQLALQLSKRRLWPMASFGSDEVLTTPVTCVATNTSILAAGLKLRWVDVDPDTCNIDMDDLARKLSSKVRAIVLVHWGGVPCDMDRLMVVLDKFQRFSGYKPKVIADCAHAWGSTIGNNKPISSHPVVDYSVFSFGPIKHLTCGDGGAIVMNDEGDYKSAKLLRWYGLNRESGEDFRCAQNIAHAGSKFHMNNINAAIGLANLDLADECVAKHKGNAEYYNCTKRIRPDATIIPKSPKNASPSSWIYTMRVDRRDSFQKMMADKGIATSMVHARNDKHSCFQEFSSILPNVDKLEGERICIPVGWWVTPEDRQYIAECINKGW